MKTFDSLAEAMADLKQRGYIKDFNLGMEPTRSVVDSKPEQAMYHVDEVYRFEGMTNPSDSSILFAISSSTGAKGVLVDAYGAYAESINAKTLKRLIIDSDTIH